MLVAFHAEQETSLTVRRFGLATRIALPIALTLAVGMAVLLAYLGRSTRAVAESTAADSALSTIAQFRLLRAYYTDSVVSKVKANTTLGVGFDHQSNPTSIPLPATMIQDLSALIEKSKVGSSLRLYSAYPFPNRKDRRLDAFAVAALAALERAPDQPFMRMETVDGRKAVRVAVADKMANATCVNCHNSRADSPKRDWKEGQMRGALEVTMPIDTALAANASMMTRLGSVAAAVLAVLALAGAWLVRRSIVGPVNDIVSALKEAADETASASAQMANSAQSLSQGATEQAASLEETSASMEEMASMTRKSSESTQSAAVLMTEVDSRVKASNRSLADMVTSMASIQESSKQVAKIIKTIDEIAFQTNILALNAAVEAARAGEAGMGFAVVADEVRNLAQRSAQAAKDTADLIETSIAKARSGNQMVEQVAASISGITDGVVKVKGLVDEISVASRQQTQGIDQVSKAIAQMEKVTQTTAATAEESAATSEELNAQAEGAMSLVAELEALVVGTGQKAVVAPRPAPPAAVAPMPEEDELPMTGTYGRF